MSRITSRQQLARRGSRRVRSRGAATAGLVAGALVLAACSGGESVDTGVEDTGGDGSGENVLRAAIAGSPDQYDPHQTTSYFSFEILENVYDTLVVPNPEDLTFEPSLASEWQTADDGLSWTFTLRDDVTFSDGSELDSADVAYSYNRIIDESLANAFRFANVESIETPDPQTVVVNLTTPTPYLLSQLGGFKGVAILPENAADDYDLATEAVGTGPFTLESADAGGAVLRTNPDYWGDEPAIDGVDVQFVSEPTAALTALRNGDIDWTDNVPPQDVASLADDDAVELGRTPSVDYWYVSFNQTRPPFDNRDLRRGIAFALNREDIAEAAKFGSATPNQTAIPEESFWYYDYSPFSEDAEAQARQLLTPFEGTEFGLMVTDEYPETVTTAQLMADTLDEYGITVNVETVDFNTWLARQGEGDFDAFALGWLGNIDPFDYYQSQHITDGSNNYQGYSNPQVDELLRQGSSEQDDEARKEIYDQAAQLIVDDVSYLYLYNPEVVHAWGPDVEGWVVRPDKAIDFANVSLG